MPIGAARAPIIRSKGAAAAAPIVDSHGVARSSSAGATSVTISGFDCKTGTGRALVVVAAWIIASTSDPQPAASMTVGGQSAPLILGTGIPAGNIDPMLTVGVRGPGSGGSLATGTNDVVCNITSPGISGMVLFAALIMGVNETDCLGNSNGAVQQANASSGSTSVTASANNSILVGGIGAGADSGGTFTADPDNTELNEDQSRTPVNSDDVFGYLGWRAAAVASTAYSFGASWSSSDAWGIGAVEILAP